jgi:hypothetical protein
MAEAKKKPAPKKAPAKVEHKYASKSAHDSLRAEFNDLKDKVGRALNIDFDAE